MDLTIRQIIRDYEAYPSESSLEKLLITLLRTNQLHLFPAKSFRQAYWEIYEAFEKFPVFKEQQLTLCQCRYTCPHHYGQGDRIPCPRCGGSGGDEIYEDNYPAWMPCYTCGTRGYVTNQNGYCFNAITPYTEIRLGEIDPEEADGDLLYAFTSGLWTSAEFRICKECDDYIQHRFALPHAPVRYWNPPYNEWGDYEGYEHDPRLDEIVDPGCLCPKCYPEPERERLIKFFRIDGPPRFRKNPDEEVRRLERIYQAEPTPENFERYQTALVRSGEIYYRHDCPGCKLMSSRIAPSPIYIDRRPTPLDFYFCPFPIREALPLRLGSGPSGSLAIRWGNDEEQYTSYPLDIALTIPEYRDIETELPHLHLALELARQHGYIT